MERRIYQEIGITEDDLLGLNAFADPEEHTDDDVVSISRDAAGHLTLNLPDTGVQILFYKVA